jgi:Rieske Fe-S protein
MKTTLLVKALPMLILVVYTVAKGLPAGRAKQASKATPAAQAPSTVAGVVQKVLEDGDFSLALVKGTGEAVWIAIRSTEPTVGQQVAYKIERCIEAYESKTLSMAFEKVLFAEDVPEEEARELS